VYQGLRKGVQEANFEDPLWPLGLQVKMELTIY
jgi:hypothetical protein